MFAHKVEFESVSISSGNDYDPFSEAQSAPLSKKRKKRLDFMSGLCGRHYCGKQNIIVGEVNKA